jgi:hypothetical protein
MLYSRVSISEPESPLQISRANMTASRRKSKKPSGGSNRSPQQPEEFTLYLDENLCNSSAILETLKRVGVHCEQHLTHFVRGVKIPKMKATKHPPGLTGGRFFGRANYNRPLG